MSNVQFYFAYFLSLDSVLSAEAPEFVPQFHKPTPMAVNNVGPPPTLIQSHQSIGQSHQPHSQMQPPHMFNQHNVPLVNNNQMRHQLQNHHGMHGGQQQPHYQTNHHQSSHQQQHHQQAAYGNHKQPGGNYSVNTRLQQFNNGAGGSNQRSVFLHAIFVCFFFFLDLVLVVFFVNNFDAHTKSNKKQPNNRQFTMLNNSGRRRPNYRQQPAQMGHHNQHPHQQHQHQHQQHMKPHQSHHMNKNANDGQSSTEHESGEPVNLYPLYEKWQSDDFSYISFYVSVDFVDRAKLKILH